MTGADERTARANRAASEIIAEANIGGVTGVYHALVAVAYGRGVRDGYTEAADEAQAVWDRILADVKS